MHVNIESIKNRFKYLVNHCYSKFLQFTSLFVINKLYRFTICVHELIFNSTDTKSMRNTIERGKQPNDL